MDGLQAADLGFYGPESVTWRLGRGRVMLLGGPRALLLQIAHPLVAAGVADFSSFRSDPLLRLRRTLQSTLALIFGSRAEASRAVARINAAHALVHGLLPEPAGRYAAGTPYDATDPELLLWVHATLVDTTFTVYTRFVGPLTKDVLDRAYEESKTAAVLLGVPEALIPASVRDFRCYMDDMLASDRLAGAPFQRAIARDVLYPPLRGVPRALHWPPMAVTAALVPPRVRELFDLELTPARRRFASGLEAAVRGILPLVPRVLRDMAQARAADRRVHREAKRAVKGGRLTDLDQLVPDAGLTRFLDERFGASEDVPEVGRLGEGHSNLTFLITRGPDRWVLRRPPRGDILPGTHEMHREFTVMKAIADAGSPVPVPLPIELCRDEGYIGAPFYLMSYVDGVVIRGPIPEMFDTTDARRGIGYELVDRLADIHALDWRGIGLAELARKPEEFLSRNLRRMQELYDAVRHRAVAEVDEAGEWLRAHAPAQADVTLTHGDYKLDNVMLAPSAPPQIAAVVDWEIATIGDPMVDLGWLLYFSPEAGDPAYEGVAGDATRSDGFPSRAELAKRYAERTGRSLDDLRFYCAMAGWKIAIIMEGSNFRFKQGMADDSLFAALDTAVPALAQRALDMISGATPVGA